MIAPLESEKFQRPSTTEIDSAIAELQAKGLLSARYAKPSGSFSTKVKQLVEHHPGAAVAVAVVIGVATGWLVKRRLNK